MTVAQTELYNGQNPRDLPLYSVAEAASYLGLAPSTLRSWVRGRDYPTQVGASFFEPLIMPPAEGEGLLSFLNLIEAHVLWSVRNKHSVPLRAVRTALSYAERELEVTRLLIRPELWATGRELFLHRYSELINLSKTGQLVMRRLLENSLQRVERDESDFPIRLFPFSRDSQTRDRLIVIDPRIAFGKPVIARTGVSAAVLAQRVDAGEELGDVAHDYDLEVTEVEEALVYVRAA